MPDSKPTVIDLFAGVGGLSLGAARAGCDVKLAVEIDGNAVKGHSVNFPSTKHCQADLSLMTGRELLREAGLKGVDGLIGGPPCQGFSSIGRRDSSDPRNQLYLHFFELVSQVRPAFFVAENVPGILTESNRPLLNQALSIVDSSYHLVGPIKIKASAVGAATTRTRVFFIGVRSGSWVPSIANTIESFADSGIGETRVKEALLGLPESVGSNWRDDGFDYWARLSARYEGWFYSKLYDEVPLGVGDPAAIERLRREDEVSGCVGTIHQERVKARYGSLKPGEVDKISKSTKLDPNGFCPTLRAGTGSDKGSYQAVRPIHPYQPRVITPREAARLQGFPDWFQFDQTKWHSFRQIGNSVSPLVAEYLLKCVFGNS